MSINIYPNDPEELQKFKQSYNNVLLINQNMDINKQIEVLKFFLNYSSEYLMKAKKTIYANLIIDKSLEFPHLYSESLYLFISFFKVLNIYCDKTKTFKIKSNKMKPIFELSVVSKFKNEMEPSPFGDLQKQVNVFFSFITKNSILFQEFISKDGLLFTILDIIINNNYGNNKGWIINEVSKIMRSIKDSSINTSYSTEFCHYFSHLNIQQVLDSQNTLFIINLFLEFSNKFKSIEDFSKKAKDEGAFDKYIFFVSRLDDQNNNTQKVSFYKHFITKNPINKYYLSCLFNSCLKFPEIQNIIFNIVPDIFISDLSKNEANEVNKCFPLPRVISEFQIPLKDTVYSLTYFQINHPELIKPCLNPFFKLLIAHPSSPNNQDDFEIYNILLSIIIFLIDNSYLSIVQLLSIDFIEAYSIHMDSTILGKLIDAFPIIIKIFYNLIKQLKDSFVKEKNVEYMKKIELIFYSFILSSPYCNKSKSQLINFFSDIIEICPTENNMKNFLQYIYEKKADVLLNVLISTISTESVGSIFIKINGLDWLENVRKIDLITMEQYSTLLSKLVCYKRFDELDNFLIKLQKKYDSSSSEKTHPLFQLDLEHLKQIAFGMNRSKNKPIRAYSLFHYLEMPDEIDPYNSWILGKYSIDLLTQNKSKDIYDIKLIKDIGNRYLNYNHVLDLLNSNPYNIKQFCDDSNYDHFPLYQFYQGKSDLTIQQPFSAISFWFKYSGEFKSELHFFSINHFSFCILNNQLIIHYLQDPNNPIPTSLLQNNGKTQGDKELTRFTINPSKWNAVFIYLADSILSSTVHIYVSQAKSSSSSNHYYSCPVSRIKFNTARFRNISSGLLFLGPSIRLFGQFDKKNLHENIFKIIKDCGPCYASKLIKAVNLHLNSSSDFFNNNNIIIKYEIKNETVYSATEANILKENVTIPPTCFCVPYFGFPYHFTSIQRISSLLFPHLKNCKNLEEFNEMLYSILNINSITKVNSDIFWTLLLEIFHDLSNSSPSLISLQIAKIIEEISCQKIYNYNNTILIKLIYNLKIWNSIKKEDLIKIIFSSFHDININYAIPDFDYFLIDLVIKNPSNKEIIKTLLIHHKEVSCTVSKLLDLLTTEEFQVFNKTDQNELFFYNNGQNEFKRNDNNYMIKLKETILSAIYNFLNNSTVNVISQYFPFKTLNLLLYSNLHNNQLSYSILNLIFQISKIKKTYFEKSIFMMLSTIYLSTNSIFLADIFDLNLYSNLSLHLFLFIVWSYFVFISHCEIFDLNNFDEITGCHDNCIKVLKLLIKKFPKEIVNSEECLIILTIWFPIVFSNIININNRIKSIDSNSEIKNWRDFYYSKSKDKNKYSIIEFQIGQVLDNYHFPIQVLKEGKEISQEKIFNENFKSKEIMDKLFDLVSEVILQIQPNTPPICINPGKIKPTPSGSFLLGNSNSNNKNGIILFDQLFSSLILCAPAFDKTWQKRLSFNNLLSFMTKLFNSNENYCFVNRFFEYLQFILEKTEFCEGMKFLAKGLLEEDLMIKNQSNQIEEILFTIFNNAKDEVSINSLIDILNNDITNFKKVIHSNKIKVKINKEIKNADSSFIWIYQFSAKKGKEQIKNSLFEKLIPDEFKNLFYDWISKPDGDSNKDFTDSITSNLEKRNKQNDINNQEFEKFENNIKDDYSNYLKDLNDTIESQMSEYKNDTLKNKKLIENKIKSLEISLFLYYEERNWNKFFTNVKLHDASLTNFDFNAPTLPSSQSMPFLFPKINKPCIFTDHQSKENLLKISKSAVNILNEKPSNENSFDLNQGNETQTNETQSNENQVNETQSNENQNDNKMNEKSNNQKTSRITIVENPKYSNRNYSITELFEKKFTINFEMDALKNVKTIKMRQVASQSLQNIINEINSNNTGNENLETEESKLDIMSFFKKHFEFQYGPIECYHNCILELYDAIKVPSVLFIFSNSTLLILTYSNIIQELGNSKSEILKLVKKQTQEDHFQSFIKLVFNQHFGRTTLFFSHVVIKLPITDIIKACFNDTQKNIFSILFWTLSSGHFVLSLSNYNLSETQKALNNSKAFNKLQQFNRESISNYPLLFKIESKEKAINSYINGNISNEDLILYLNGNKGNSFVCFKIFPEIPFIKDYEGQNAFLSIMDNNSNQIKSNSNQFKSNQLNSTFQLHQEEYLLNTYDILPFLHEKFDIVNIFQKSKRNTVASFNSIFTNQVINNNYIFSIKLKQEKMSNKTYRKIAFINNNLFFLSNLEASLPNNYIVRVVPELMMIQILRVNFDNNFNNNDNSLLISNSLKKSINYTEIYFKVDPIFSSAKAINASNDGNFVVVDFEFGISRIYRLFYYKSVAENSQCPYKYIDAVIFNEFLLDNSNEISDSPSCISASYLLAITCDTNERLVFWGIKPTESTLGIISESSAIKKKDIHHSQTFWATPAEIYSVIDLKNDRKPDAKNIENNSSNNFDIYNNNNSNYNNNNNNDNNCNNNDNNNNSDYNDNNNNDNNCKNNSYNNNNNDDNNTNNNDKNNDNNCNYSNCNDRSVVFKVDDDGVWIGKGSELLLYTLNSEKVAQLDIRTVFRDSESKDFSVTAIDVCRSPINEHFAIIGLKCGQIILASPRFDTHVIETKILNSPHLSKILSISIDRRDYASFSAMDENNVVSLWSVLGNNETKKLGLNLDRCHLCNRKNPTILCSSCNMLVCSNCHRNDKCLVCSSLDRFIHK